MLYSLQIISQNKNNIQVSEEMFNSLIDKFKELYTDKKANISKAYSKSKELVTFLDKKFPFFDKSIKTTNLCSIFAVLYDYLSKILAALPLVSKNQERPTRIEYKSTRELRNKIDNSYVSPKNHVEVEVVKPLEYINDLVEDGDKTLDYNDCVYINSIISIVYSDIESIVNEKSSLILGRDYQIDFKEVPKPPTEEELREEYEQLEKERKIASIKDIFRDVMEEDKKAEEDNYDDLEDDFDYEDEDDDTEDDIVEEDTTTENDTQEDTNIKEEDNEEDIDDEDGNLVIESLKKEETNMKTDNIEQSDLKDISDNLDKIKQQIEKYRDIKSSIDEVKIPDKLAKTSPEIVENIKKTVNQQIDLYLTPIKNELTVICDDTFTKIDSLISKLNKDLEYINNIQHEIN